MTICDLTQFYSPVSGGVRRYLHEKSRYIQEHRQNDRHIWIIPGDTDRVEESCSARVHMVQSPMVSRTSRYRLLWRLERVEQILEREQPDLVESGDPYQVAWKAQTSAQALGFGTTGFYHSHFPEAYFRSAMKYFGDFATEIVMECCREYIVRLYSGFDRTIVPSSALAALLQEWGVRNVAHVDLGVNIADFFPDREAGLHQRKTFGFGERHRVLLYVGRLAPEKNLATLLSAFGMLRKRDDRYRLIVVGDGTLRHLVSRSAQGGCLHWIPTLERPGDLPDIYRAADVFVHPGLQETFGLVNLEAQACGTPVIGIRGSYMDRLIFSGLDGWATENTSQALADAIDGFWATDPAERGIAAAGIVRSRYSWQKAFDRLFAVYTDVIQSYRSPPHDDCASRTPSVPPAGSRRSTPIVL